MSEHFCIVGGRSPRALASCRRACDARANVERSAAAAALVAAQIVANHELTSSERVDTKRREKWLAGADRRDARSRASSSAAVSRRMRQQ